MKTFEEILKKNVPRIESHVNYDFIVKSGKDYASQFTPDRERVIEILQKYERKIDDSDYHDTAVFNCDYKSIADELRSLPNHSEDNLDMVSLPEEEEKPTASIDDIRAYLKSRNYVYMKRLAKKGGKG